MSERLHFRENVPVAVPANGLRSALADAIGALRNELRPTLPQLAIDGEIVRFQNLVGSFRLHDGSVVEVAPKVDVDNWAKAVVQLLEHSTRIAVTGSQRSQSSTRRNDLAIALAHEYARRLESAVRSDGPIHAYERRHITSRRLKGHLNVTMWTRSAILDPARFPVALDELSSSNDFSRGLSLIAGFLSRVAVGTDLAGLLRQLQSAVIPGHPIPTYVNPAVARRELPTQWARYRPAWDIAAPLLRSRSAVGDPGRAIGLEVAVEPWRLLENQLNRILHRVEKERSDYKLVPRTKSTLLSKNGVRSIGVEPDGILHRNGGPAATFECKYTVANGTPNEKHVHQALTTAAALRAPLSFLVYPGDQAPVSYDVAGFGGQPAKLITVGTGLYSYRRGIGEIEGARKILHLMDEILATPLS
ncbi:5-methylcytosine restriction system specificity protein McrC [Nocardia cyriacigeorgica]|uniref:5-methylcytosine restriction system specificity protein McrC n=1 Tax=Nocardia cyriacigeorgica TaxID=135487 RepID=UPI003CC7F98E